MSVDLTRTLEIAALIGGETLSLPLDTTDSTPSGRKLDNVVSVLANYNAGVATTLWQAASHGAAGPPVAEFTNLIVAVDPKRINTAVPYINIELAYTKTTNNAVTYFCFQLGRNGLLHIDSAVAGGSEAAANAILVAATATGGFLTRVRATNPHATIAVDVRTIVLA